MSRRFVILLVCWPLLLAAQSDGLLERLTKFPHRIPGSPEQAAAMQTVSDYLKQAGLDPQVQTFPGIGRDVLRSDLKVVGKTSVEAHPLHNGVGPWVMPEPRRLRVVDGGNGSREALSGKRIDRHTLVLLDLNDPDIAVKPAFSLGAYAICLIGDDPPPVWQLTHLTWTGPAAVPALYVHPAAAAAAGLEEGAEVDLQVHTRMVDVQGANLWLHIPATSPKTFNFSQPEALILSAPLDSFGLVPTYSPDERGAANAALLAEMAVSLAEAARKGETDRDLILVWWGSRNHGQVAARYFYYTYYQAGKIGHPHESLAARRQGFERELKDLEGPLRALESPDLFADESEYAIQLRPRIKHKLTGIVNAYNSQIRDLRLSLNSLERQADEGSPDPELRREMESVQQEIQKISAEKSRWNLLRKSQNDGELSADEPIRRVYGLMIRELEEELRNYQKYLEEMLVHIETWEPLLQLFQNRRVVGHFDFDFSNDQQPWVFAMIGDPDVTGTKNITIGHFQKFLSLITDVVESDPVQAAGEPGPFQPALRPFYKPSALSQPWVRSVPSSIGIITGVTGFQLMNIGGGDLEDEGLPLRTGTRLEGLLQPLRALILAMTNEGAFSITGPISNASIDTRLTYSYKGGGDFLGRRFEDRAKGSQDIEGPSDRALIMIKPGEPGESPGLPGQLAWPVVRINANGFFWAPLIPRDSVRHASARFFGIGYTPEGAVERISTAEASRVSGAGRTPLFYTQGGAMLDNGISGTLLDESWGGEQTGVLDAGSDSSFRTAHALPLPGVFHIYTDKKSQFKYVGDQGELLLGSSRETPKGQGYSLDPENLLRMDTAALQTKDNWLLNDQRLRALRERNIVNDTLESLHADAEDFLREAKDREDDAEYGRAAALNIFSALMSYRVHGPLKAATQDLVHAVVVLLLLNIPFAFAMERMIFGFTSIYKQVGGFVAFFVGTFLLLYFTHPAFALASAPIVIFLAFVIILLSGITVGIVMGKIKQEIRTIQGMASTAHGVGNDSNTAIAAVLIGISGMRNRPLKTFLTALTVVLLTFTILAFASFSSELGVVKTYLGQGSGPERIELHRHSFLGIQDEIIDSVEEYFGDDFEVTRRGGLFPNPTRKIDQRSTSLKSDIVAHRIGTPQLEMAHGLMGLMQEEVARDPRLSALLKDFGEPTASGHPRIYLNRNATERLKAAPGDLINVTGRLYEAGEAFDANVLRNLNTLEGFRMVLPDFREVIAATTVTGRFRDIAEEMEQVDVSQLDWMAPEDLMITDLTRLRDRARDIVDTNMLVLYPKSEEADIEEASELLAKIFSGSVHAKATEGVTRYFFTRAISGSGLNDVVVPLLLGGLIIFSSLMGSIVDREKEIFTYSALGLSPPDVGMLFFAESAVYSVVGGMGGYLVSQVVAKIATLLSEADLVQMPAMNFSSLSSVMTILVVMAVVMLSTIVPAVKAGRSANPGINRKWKMPAPEGDRLEFVFPFTVSKADFQGIISFIYEHFENHSDATLGNFAARDIRLFQEKSPETGKERQGIEANLSLAPFDLGVFQSFRMYSKEFDLPGIEEVVVEIERIGGMPGSWIRGNRQLAEDLRNQFLIWRSLPIDSVQTYRSQTRERIASSSDLEENPAHV